LCGLTPLSCLFPLGINPEEYLYDILPRLPEMTNRTAKNYTPAQWKAGRPIQ